MATRVRCLKCFKIIECAPYDTSILLEHIRTYHPEIMLPDNETTVSHDSENYRAPTPRSMYTNEPVNETNRNPDSRQYRPRNESYHIPVSGSTMEEITIRHPGQKPMYTRKYNIHSPKVPRSPQKRRMYKTSVEKWRPAKGKIYCPKCGALRRPIIRSRSEKMSYSSVGAACILTCWPLCFLPCIFPAPAQNYLHCAECNNFLGMYDEERNCLRPNKDFVDGTSNKLTEDMDAIDPVEQREMVPTPTEQYPDGGFGSETGRNTDVTSKMSADRKTV